MEGFIEKEAMMKVHPAVAKVWRWNGIVGALITTAIWFAIEFAVIQAWPPYPFNFPVLFLIFAIYSVFRSIVFVNRQYDEWRYLLTDTDLILRWGVYWKTLRYIPRESIQHLDINQGPVDRRFDLVKVGVYTAGAAASVGEIPGLTRLEAEELRDRILTRPDSGN